MKEIYEQADQLAIEAQIIADNLLAYNPGLGKDKIPLDVLIADIRKLTYEYVKLGVDIAKRYKKND